MEPQRLTFTLPTSGQPESRHRMTCHQWGDPNARRTLLCVHGLTRNGRDFDVLAQAICGEYRVLCPDMPGRGDSEWLKEPQGYNYPAYAADIFYMLDALNITRLDWLGTSMGGILGMMAANLRPGLIGALALNDIGCIVSAAGLARILAYAGSSPVFHSRAEAEAALRERCAPFGIREEAHWQQLFAHSFQELPDGTLRFACDPAILASLPPDSGSKDIDLWPLWEKVREIPVLLLRGAQSDLLSHDTALAMQTRHPALTLHEIPETGHAPALMAQEQIEMVKQWLNRLQR